MGFLVRLVIVLTLLTMCTLIVTAVGAACFAFFMPHSISRVVIPSADYELSDGRNLWEGGRFAFPSTTRRYTKVDPVTTFRMGGSDIAVIPHVVSLGLGFMLCFAMLCALVIWRLTSRSAGRRHGQAGAEETKLIQELYNGFSRMENRVESLETILLEGEHGRVKDPR